MRKQSFPKVPQFKPRVPQSLQLSISGQQELHVRLLLFVAGAVTAGLSLQAVAEDALACGELDAASVGRRHKGVAERMKVSAVRLDAT